MRKSLLFVFFCFYAISWVQGQKFVNEFLNIGAGARSHGMAGAVIATGNDGTSALWNPAGLTNMSTSLQVNAMHAEWFAGVANYDYGSIVKRINEETNAYGGLSFVRFGIDNIPYTLNLIGPDGSVNYDEVSSFSAVDYGVFLSYGQSIIDERIRLGGNIKVINRNIGQFANAWGFGADLGFLFKENRFTLAVMAKDITTTYNSWSFNFSEEEKAVFSATNNDIPVSSTEVALPRVILGAAFHDNKENYTSTFQYAIEANVKFSGDSRAAGIGGENINIDPAIGVELGYKNLVYLRGGIGNVERSLNELNGPRQLSLEPNVGLGLNLGRIGVDYALTNIGDLGEENGAFYSHIFSLRLNFDPR
jgi:hypothetical protein